MKTENYRKSVMQRAWTDFKFKKSHKGYEELNFSQSLYNAHKTIKAIINNPINKR